MSRPRALGGDLAPARLCACLSAGAARFLKPMRRGRWSAAQARSSHRAADLKARAYGQQTFLRRLRPSPMEIEITVACGAVCGPGPRAARNQERRGERAAPTPSENGGGDRPRDERGLTRPASMGNRMPILPASAMEGESARSRTTAEISTTAPDAPTTAPAEESTQEIRSPATTPPSRLIKGVPSPIFGRMNLTSTSSAARTTPGHSRSGTRVIRTSVPAEHPLGTRAPRASARRPRPR